MSALLRGFALLVLVLLLWPEFARYRAEWLLADVNVRLQRALSGADRGTLALQSVSQAADAARAAAPRLPGDPRPPMLEAIALILVGNGNGALAVLDAAIADGERPELTINRGRALTIVGDKAGANAAYLRTAWASPLAIETLPKSMRETLSAEVARLEIELQAGRLNAVPGD